MSLRLYGYWRSSATYRVRIALNLKQLAYEYHPVSLKPGDDQQRSEEYSALNPAKLVPTFYDDDEDVILNQSLSIIEYLDEKYDSGQSLLPSHKLDRARVRAIALDLAAETQPLGNLRVLQYLREQLGQGEDAVQVWMRHWMTQTFNGIEKRLQTTAGEYCFGFDVTMADAVLVPQVYNAKRFNLDMSAYPLISKITDKCNQLDAFIQAAPENQVDAVL